MPDIQELDQKIYNAEKNLKPVPQFTEAYPNISVDQAYAAQLKYVDRRLEDGTKIVGKKIGLTSKAMQEMLGVDRPDYGHILYDMVFSEKEPINTSRFIAPRVEFEIAFVLAHDIEGKNVTVESVAEAVDYVVPAAEIIDSRIKDWKIKFEDTVSDNGSSAGAVLGQNKVSLGAVDLPSIKMDVYRNGEKLDEGYGSAVLGNPLEAVVWLAKALHQYDITLKAGEIVLAGGLTKAVDVAPGDEFKAVFEGLGTVEVSFS